MDPLECASPTTGETRCVQAPSTSARSVETTSTTSTAETVESPTINAAMSRKKQRELQKRDYM